MPDGRSEDIGINRRNPRNRADHLALTEMDSFDTILLSKQISAVKRSFYVRTCPVRKRKAHQFLLLEIHTCMWGQQSKQGPGIHRSMLVIVRVLTGSKGRGISSGGENTVVPIPRPRSQVVLRGRHCLAAFTVTHVGTKHHMC